MGPMWDWITAHWNDDWARFVEGLLLFLIIFVLTLLQFRATRSRIVYAD